MITVVVSGQQRARGQCVSKAITDALIGSRFIVRYFPKGRPAEMPDDQHDEVVNIIDETQEIL